MRIIKLDNDDSQMSIFYKRNSIIIDSGAVHYLWYYRNLYFS